MRSCTLLMLRDACRGIYCCKLRLQALQQQSPLTLAGYWTGQECLGSVFTKLTCPQPTRQVHDGPLLEYLGVKPSKPKFAPTFFSHDVRPAVCRCSYVVLDVMLDLFCSP